MDGILKELRDLAARGYKEVTLLGQNVNSYGHDLPEQGIDFSDLLAAADETGVARVRFLTSHPKDLSPKLVTTIANGKHLCEQIHLPVQAGSDRTLKRMGRRYTVEQYLEKVNMIRSQMPEVAITTDLIVGFPGETEAEYEETLQLVSRVRFGAAFTFAYSVRPGTPAARMPEQVPEPEKLRRLQGLIDLQNSVSKEESARLVGKIEEVLVEGQSERDPAMLAGRTRTNRMVHFAGPADLTGTFRHVRITSSHTFTLMGELIPQKEGQA
jgi:tRNA-2-methylthio-N6-dimethylallyladenosine synthase